MVNSNIFAASFAASTVGATDFVVSLDHNSYFAVVAQVGSFLIVLPDLQPLSPFTNSRMHLLRNGSPEPVQISCSGTGVFDGGIPTFTLDPHNWAIVHGDSASNSWNVYHVWGATVSMGLGVRYSSTLLSPGTVQDPGAGNVMFTTANPASATGMSISYFDATGALNSQAMLHATGKRGIMYFTYGNGVLIYKVKRFAGGYGTFAEMDVKYVGGTFPAPATTMSLVSVPMLENEHIATVIADGPTSVLLSGYSDDVDTSVEWRRDGTGLYVATGTGQFNNSTYMTINTVGSTPHPHAIGGSGSSERSVQFIGPTGAIADPPLGFQVRLVTPDA